MRRLVKAPKPQILVEKETPWTQEYLALLSAGAKKLPSRWRHPEIKATLAFETTDKCAYCDSTMAVVNFPHVEHIRPKARFPELVVTWENLTIVCERCNNEKLDYWSDSTPLLNPYEDNPDDHLLFIGDLIMPRPGSDRGLMTVQKLGLSRQHLISQRLERVKAVLSFVESWARAKAEDVRQEILAIITEDVQNGPYQKNVLAVLKQCGIDLQV